MTPRLPDTNIVSRLLRHDAAVHGNLRTAVRSGSRIILSPVVEFEARRGFLRSKATTLVVRFEQLTGQFQYCPFDRSVWLRAAAFWAMLRDQGIPLVDADILIAAQAYEQNAALVTK